MNSRTLCAVLFSFVPGAMVSGGVGPQAWTQADDQAGTVTALVLHSETEVPLAGMPVFITSVPPPEGSQAIRIVTGKNGTAQATGLPDGMYRAVVEYNNNVSEPAIFEIRGGGPENVKIFFNPDID